MCVCVLPWFGMHIGDGLICHGLGIVLDTRGVVWVAGVDVFAVCSWIWW